MKTMKYNKFWDRDIEKLSFEELYEKKEKLLQRRQLKYIMNNSKFYQKKYDRAGIKREDVLNKEFDYSRLPFTEKTEIIEDQQNYPPFGELLAAAPEKVIRVHRTSGYSGKPVLIALTAKDAADTAQAGARMFWCAGLRPGDVVVHCLNYCLWIGGLTDHLSLEQTGATVIPYGVGNSKNLIELIQQVHPSAISCTPSYLTRLEELLRDDFGLTPRDLNIKIGLLGGESGIQNPAIRTSVEDTWGMQAIDANFGVSDVLSAFGSECECRDGLHFHGQGIIRVELIDPARGKNIGLQGGQVGELVYTNLTREGQPLIRFRSHDIAEIISTRECECGRNSFRFRIIGRSDDMVTVKGINIFPNAIKSVLIGFPESLTGEFEIHLDSPPPYEFLNLKIECKSNIRKTDKARIKEVLASKIRQALTCTARIDLVAQGSIVRSEGKAKRIIRKVTTHAV